MMCATQQEPAGGFLYFEAFLVVATMYWAIVERLSFQHKRLELQLNTALAR
jgi:ABC-type amino acid transport system permease subunit